MSIPSWDPVAAPLARRRTVVRFDFRGQFLSPGQPPATFAEHAEDVVRLLDALGLARADLLGTSFGGLVALVVAARWPERVRRLLIVTATAALDGPMREKAALLERRAREAAAGGDGAELFRLVAAGTFSAPFLARQPADWIETRAAATATMPREWFEAVAGLMAALGTLDLDGLLPRIAAPTLVIGAALDRTFPVDNSRALAAAIRGARLEILDGVGHGAVVEAPELIVALVEGFLRTTAGDGVVREGVT